MKKEFIPYNEALALKELGFDEPCFMFYEQGTKDKYLNKGINDEYWGDYSEPQKWNSMPNKPWKPFCQCISAPLYQQAFRWFRETHNISGEIGINVMEDDEYCYEIGDIKTRMCIDEDSFSTYEQAELECLKKLISIVKNK